MAGINFVGRGGGNVKALAGFKKGHHTVPDAANATTNAFLGRLCAVELADEAEKLFQAVRAGFDYKRKDIALSVTSPLAVLGAKDFTVEIFYALEERDPARYATTTTLRGLLSAELARSEAMGRIFAGRFTEISFALKKGASIEAVIDAIEELDGDDGLAVAYPSDWSECTITVEGVEASVRCTGATLEIVFPRAGGPAELIEAFVALREAFRISKGLSGLIV
ncbi:MAG TPA: hypothetical protein VHD62_16475 [Opitutaceae bacterium]|nr:hypothetical protein [Opitutaceae bacterium]